MFYDGVKNRTAFTGGQNEYTQTVTTSDDTNRALTTARYTLTIKEKQHPGLLARPCQETKSQTALVLTVSWTCRFVTYTPPTDGTVLSARVSGNSVLLEIQIVVRAHPVTGK